MKIFVSFIVLCLAQFAFSAIEFANVIYGEDHRVDVYESTQSQLVELSLSTAAMIENKNLKSHQAGQVLISANTLSSQGICSKERFAGQIAAANCSGFLVAPNILVTAGHCVESQMDCSSSSWVFDYKVSHADQKDIIVSKSSVYKCSKIIGRALDDITKNDYAVLLLDRSVLDRRPLPFRKTGKISVGTSLAVIGHPSGLPTKIADGAEVRGLDTNFFQANLDTYGGNSGSAVINTSTGEVEGILVRGERDYVFDPTLGCQVSHKCPNTGCRGEDVTYITHIKELKKY
jgi:V8-like Glu-specific endopeptidase